MPPAFSIILLASLRARQASFLHGETLMGKITVIFQPESTRTEANSGDKLIDVASGAGIDISNLCGGQGVCGRCRVQVQRGRINLSNKVIGKLSRKEMTQGYTLACQAELAEDDVEVRIPPESRSDIQIQISDYIVSFDEPTSVHGPEYGPAPIIRPLCEKYYLELSPPTIDDSLSDLDRVYRALRKKIPEYPHIQAHFSCLWGLAALLRANKWEITATVHFHDTDCPMIREIEGGNTTSRNRGIAIDVGTTTIAAQLVDLRTGTILACRQAIIPRRGMEKMSYRE